MDEIHGTYQDGQVNLDGPVAWPNGARVAVSPVAAAKPSKAESDVELWGLDPAHYEETPEFRENLMAQVDSFEPLELTPDEEAEWKAARRWRKEHSLAAVREQMGLTP